MLAIGIQTIKSDLLGLPLPHRAHCLLAAQKKQAESETHRHGLGPPLEKKEDEGVDREDTGNSDTVSQQRLGHDVFPQLVVLPRSLLEPQHSRDEIDEVEAPEGESTEHEPHEEVSCEEGRLSEPLLVGLEIVGDGLHLCKSEIITYGYIHQISTHHFGQNTHKHSILPRKFPSNLSRLIFQKVSRRITNSSTTQSTTCEAKKSSYMRSLGMLVMNFLRRSLRLLSMSSIEYCSSEVSCSLNCPMSALTSASSVQTQVMKLRIIVSSVLSSYYFRTDSRMAASSLSTLRRMRKARARGSVCSQTARLTAKDSISMHFWWLFSRISFRKFYLNALLAVQVLRNSLLALVNRGLQISSEPSLLRGMRVHAYRFWEAAREELAFVVVSERVKDRLRLFLGVRSRMGVRMSAPFLTSQANTSLQSALKLGFLVIILRSNLVTSGASCGWGGMQMSSSSIIMINLPILLLSKGQKPQSMRKRTTPSDQISDLMEQVSPLRIQGAMQMGEPSIVLEISSWVSRGLQKPKSANLMMPSWSSKFSGLRSLCMMLCLLRTLKASTIWAKQVRATVSGSMRFSLRSFSRVPPLQNSQTKQKLLAVLSISKYLMMCGHGQRVERMFISLQVPSYSLGYCLNFSAFTILIATSCLFFMFIARYTVEYMPRPISLCSEQLSIILPILYHSTNIKQIAYIPASSIHHTQHTSTPAQKNSYNDNVWKEEWNLKAWLRWWQKRKERGLSLSQDVWCNGQHIGL